ncbi:MAG: hypothetical protein IJF71_06615, partial [Clostridia bacterium]|nr:hypothetical protein [Clostridia bacterium]
MDFQRANYEYRLSRYVAWVRAEKAGKTEECKSCQAFFGCDRQKAYGELYLAWQNAAYDESLRPPRWEDIDLKEKKEGSFLGGLGDLSYYMSRKEEPKEEEAPPEPAPEEAPEDSGMTEEEEAELA